MGYFILTPVRTKMLPCHSSSTRIKLIGHCSGPECVIQIQMGKRNSVKETGENCQDGNIFTMIEEQP